MNTLKKALTFKTILDLRLLRRLGGERSFERGKDYFINGQVKLLVEQDGMITAKVHGTHKYEVKLWIEKGELDYSCSCPVGDDGMFCKHCVAVGLAWLKQPEEIKRPEKGKISSRKSTEATVTMDDVQAFLAGQGKNELIKMLLEHAKDDERLSQRLFVKASRKNPKCLDLASYKNAIDNAVDVGEFVDYRGMFAYARNIEKAIDSLEELLDEGRADEVIELSEHALAAVEDAIGSVDDSDGQMGDILSRLQEIHHSACKKAKPDPKMLAKRLFAWELRTDWDTFYGAVQTYADVLGEEGLAVYRKLAEEEWGEITPVKPGREESEEHGGKRFRITSIMEMLAKRSGDSEALVAVMQKNLSHAYDFLQIAELYKKMQKPDLALEWAERGVQAFPKQTDSRLREFLANEYHNLKRHDEAMVLIWQEFIESLDLEQYRNLKAHADRMGEWSVWREKALLFLHEQISKEKKRERKDIWIFFRADHSILVKIFLWEKDIEAAWHEAQIGGCSNELWLKLASLREQAHPEDALGIYQKQIEPVLNQKNNIAYREAVGFLRKIQQLMDRLGQEKKFAQYLESVRLAHKPKRNFMKMLDRAKWEKHRAA